MPAKTYSLKEVGMDLEEVKARNYENSNRSVVEKNRRCTASVRENESKGWWSKNQKVHC